MSWLAALAAAVVAAIFTVMLAARWRARRQPYEAVWALAMAMYAIASVCLAIGAAGGWGDITFRGYWLFGAILTVPFLAAGEALLLFRSSRARAVVLGLLAVLSVLAAIVVFATPIYQVAYRLELPRGALAYEQAPLPLALARAYAYVGFALLIAGTLLSAWRMRGNPALRGRFAGTLLIALGASVVAGGSAFAAAGLLLGFSLTLLAGICLMFWGFLAASRRPGTLAHQGAPARE